MPFLDILGSTELNYTFFIAFIFLSREKEKDYTAALKMLFTIIQTQKIALLGIIITDKDQELMNTIFYIFLQSHNLLYN
jgi:MULE transposase domain